MKHVDSIRHSETIRKDTIISLSGSVQPQAVSSSTKVSKLRLSAGIALMLTFSGSSVFALNLDKNPTENPEEISTEAESATETPTPKPIDNLLNVDELGFFKTTKAQFINQKIDFIEGDLSAMIVRVYKGGEVVKEVPILSKGKEGSWWETPAGLYQIEGKEINHFSSFGHVNMPFSMPFQGNFFIHGWPTYPGGAPVAEGYSGGCIRLSTENAEEVFNLAEVGMPVLVVEEDFQVDEFEHKTKGGKVDAKAYVTADLKSNYIFTEKNAGKSLPIASITKLMTALIATEYINIEKEVEITEDMLVYTTIPRLEPGERYSVFSLLHPLLTESSNEAANAIADSIGRERFISLMNKKAKAIGMTDTVFVDPHGISEENISSTKDLFQLAKYLYHNRSFILNISNNNARQSVYGPPAFKDLKNFNIFTEYPEFVGGKVGSTIAAKETIVSIFEVDTEAGKRPVVIIVLGSDHAAEDAKYLFNEAFPDSPGALQ